MEKLKAKHDHKLTDILKVAIFGLMLILPGLILLPSMLYYGVNEHATAPTEQIEKIEYERVDFNQQIKNGNFESTNYWYPSENVSFEVISNDMIVVSSTQYYGVNTNISPLNIEHKYLFKFTAYSDNVTDLVFYHTGRPFFTQTITNTAIDYTVISIPDRPSTNVEISPYSSSGTYYLSKVMMFDLTQMFGVGNEPTAQQFNNWYTNEYYEYTESRYEILEKPTGTYETYTDITSQIQFNWNSLWQQPLFIWTNYTILKQGLDNFTYVFGITQTSYITNLIAYELIIVAIYIVIDIVLTLFKWLTHLIGEK